MGCQAGHKTASGDEPELLIFQKEKATPVN
jgi:hypothetical protein